MLQRRVSLEGLNTFGFSIVADLYAEIQHVSGLESLWKTNLLDRCSPMIHGGGSNLLFTGDYPGLILRNCILGQEVVSEIGSDILVRFGGGENWHQTVMYAVSKGWGGIENLSLIPGTVGAAPIQNIGAYGVELKDVFDHLRAFDFQTGKLVTFHHADCGFGYRDSIFKNEARGRYFIVDVTLKLSKETQIHIEYGDIQKVLEERGISHPGIADVSNAVIQIRQSKLPDPAEIGNCGSFFKNPVVPEEKGAEIISQYPDARIFPASGGVKIPAAWLIEKCGWKGYRRGQYGVHEKQALVLVNYGGATGDEVYNLALEIQESVDQRFGVQLEMEVNVV